MRRWLLPLVVYLAAAAVTTWPLLLHPSAVLGAQIGPGDPYLNLWILGWDMQTLLSAPRALLTGAIFNANIFYPATGTLLYSDHLLLQAIVLLPIYAISHDAVLCYNVLLAGSLVATAIAMHAFARAVVGDERSSYVAGLAWGFGSYHFSHLIHLQLQSLYFLPLTFLFLHRIVAGRRTRDAIMLGIVTALQAISSVYYAVIGGLALVVGGIALAAGVGRWRSTAVYRRLIAAALLAAVLAAPIALMYWRVGQREGFGRSLYEAAHNSAYIVSYLQASPGNMLYGRTGLLRQRDVPGPMPHTGPERELFPGFALIALAIAGAVTGWRSDARAIVLTMMAVGTTGFVLSLGPDGVRPIYAAAYNVVFGFSVIRAPARFSVLLIFALCVLAAIAVRRLSRPFAIAAVLAVAFELSYMPPTLVGAPAFHTDVGAWLAREPGPGAVAVLPIDLDVGSTPAMVQSLEHRRPIVNGYSGQRPSFYQPLAEALNTFPSTDALVALRDSSVRFVVTPMPVAAAPPVIERARFAGAVIYELQWTPELETRLTANTAIEPRAPGPIPFQPGETAKYRVDWAGGGVNLPAGDITIAVEPPAYRFVVTAVTAPWVARFFDAHDTFATQTDAMVFPQVHEREQREGSRHVTRVFVFDSAAHVVRSAPTLADARGAAAVVLPMTPYARDAIAALFYARTLPLEPGERDRFPVNEAGRNLVVDLAVDGIEHVHAEGREQDGIRLTPLLEQRTQDRSPMAATVWLSRDERRVPLALEVDAGFGHVRVELESYTASRAIIPALQSNK
jgi:hypothetical protein